VVVVEVGVVTDLEADLEADTKPSGSFEKASMRARAVAKLEGGAAGGAAAPPLPGVVLLASLSPGEEVDPPEARVVTPGCQIGYMDTILAVIN
jgi:hypothetical protein